MNVKKDIAGLVNFIKEEVTLAGKKGCTIGVSGGIDSAVTAALCKLAFPGTTYGISMPMEGNVHGASSRRAKIFCNRLDILLETAVIAMIGGGGLDIPKKAKGNYYARMRMARLYLQAEVSNTLVIGTDNWCESYIGYFTKFGDGGVDINPLGNYLKSEVKRLAVALNVTDEIIKAAPSAELWDDQTDEDELGFTYNQLDEYLTYCYGSGLKNSELGEDVINKIRQMHKSAAHKRRLPKVYER